MICHLEELGRGTAASLGCHIEAGKCHDAASILVVSRAHHGICLSLGKTCSRHRGITQRSRELQILDPVLVFLRCLDGVYSKGDNLDAAQVTPLCREFLVQSLGKLRSLAGELAIADTHERNLRKSRLQGREQLTLELGINPVARILHSLIATDVFIEEQRVHNLIGIFAVALDGDIGVKAYIGVYDTEGHGVGSAILVS